MIPEENPRLNSQTKVVHLSPRIVHQERIKKADKRVQPKKLKMHLAELSAAGALKTCAQSGQLQCTQVYLCSYENVGQNEDWHPIFILFLPECLGRILITGDNCLVYNISFS
jgi:hypothetical protein